MTRVLTTQLVLQNDYDVKKLQNKGHIWNQVLFTRQI